MKTHIFKAMIEPDDDRWAAYCPALLKQGASTWGATREEALTNLRDVVRMLLESLVEHGELVLEGAGAMSRTIRVRVRGGLLEPLEKVDLP